ncbi:MAG TPA: HDOD domain-containing protein [Terriglobales bacterium]|nr:HDOD domain-containing protein [Terriglobales bacterium]
MYQRFIARQPILTYKLALLGYELFFRGGTNGKAPSDANATSHVISASTMLFQWESLLGRSLAFVNFGESEVLNGAAYLLPATLTVVELAPSLPASAEVIQACKDLQEAKYRLALDDFRGLPQQQALLPLVDFLKVDFRETTEKEQLEISRKYGGAHAALVAKKVETWKDFRYAKALQYHNFQGFFFLEPQVLERKEIASTKANALRLLQAIHENPMNLRRIEEILKQEPAFSVKLLRYLNSPILARPTEITSLHMAITLLGEQEFRRWASLAAVITPTEDKPAELIRTALMRAFFCEEMARLAHPHSATFEFFLVGLLSVMNAILDQPLEYVVGELAVSARVREALTGEGNELRQPLNAALAYERGDWAEFARIMEKLAMPEELVPDCFLEANRNVKALMA